MKRRRLIALVSACVLLFIGFVTVFTGWMATRTDFGREQIRSVVQEQLTRAMRGKVYIGRISGSLLTGIIIDSLAIRDADDDSLFLSTGRVVASYDPRDLIDKRVWIRRLDVEHPRVYLREHANGRWNFKEILRNYEPQKPGPKTPGRSFGDYVIIDSAHVTNGTFVLQMPWSPDDSLRGAKLDSSVAYTLSRPDKEIRGIIDDGKPSFARTWRWTSGNAYVSHIRIADPDSNKFGRVFNIDSLSVNETDPPFSFRHIARATVLNKGDSIWVDVPRFELPASVGSGKGKIWWGNDLPIRLDIAARGDSVSLKDVAWVYPTLPTTGGGTVDLRIQNERDLHVIDYKLANMDVRSTRSHLAGDMTFGVGAPVLIVKDVRMTADPFDFDLLRALNGKPFPEDWRGPIYGTVRGRGGPLNHFVVDAADATWHDTHVNGAQSHFGGHGELDILNPAFTAFHDFDADVQALDLRSIQYLFPSFPKIGGIMSGTAMLDSSWLDIRFSDADVMHQPPRGEPSHITGSGRVTWGQKYMTYDVDLQAQPASITGLFGGMYPHLVFTGLVSGPVQAKGTISNLQLNTSLQGAMGSATFNGLVDIDTPWVAAKGTGEFSDLDVRRLLAANPSVVTSLNGRYDVDLGYDSLANMKGSAIVQLARSRADSVRVFPSYAHVRFDGSRMYVDSLNVETAAASVTATGALGLPHGARDSLHFAVNVDSLGGLRRYIGSKDPKVSGAADSLSGILTAGGAAIGTLDSLDLNGFVSGTNLYVRKDRGRSATAHFDLHDVLANPSGIVSLRLDTLTLAGVIVDTIGGTLRMTSRSQGRYSLGAQSLTGPKFTVAGDVHRGAADSVVIGIDTLTTQLQSSAWTLAAPTRLVSDSSGTALDALSMRSTNGGRFRAQAAVPLSGPVSIEARGDNIELGDIAELAQLTTGATGRANLDMRVIGTRAQPLVSVVSNVDSLHMGAMRVERVTSTGSYRDRRFDAGLDLFLGGRSTLSAKASLPIDLSEFHFRETGDSLRGSIRADSADLAVLEAFSPSLEKASGRLNTNLSLGGTWDRPTLGGSVLVSDGDLTLSNLGIRLQGIEADVAAIPGADSIAIRKLTAWSGRGPADDISLGGYVSFADRSDPRLDLRLQAHSFHALDKKTLARLDISTLGDGLHLFGRNKNATLAGTVRVDRGALFLPDADLARKQVEDLTGADVFSIVDSTDFRNRTLLPDAPPTLVENLQLENVSILLGDDVWLRSREADIKLGGALNVTRAPDESRSTRSLFGGRGSDRPVYRLALDGTLRAERGTYTLDLVAVQREFQVQGGTITFTGQADNNPLIDISALYNVRRPKESDLPVIVRVHGPLVPNPVIDLSSPESYISPTDLASYLVTGLPSFQLSESASRTVAQTLLPTASTVLASNLRRNLGSWVDMIQFGAVDTQQGTTTGTLNPVQQFFYQARLGGQTQVGRDLFFSFSAGLCPAFQQTGAADQMVQNLVGAVGGKLEYRVNSDLSLQAGHEPSTQALYCVPTGQALRSLVPTPSQWSLSLLRTWRF